MIRILLIFNFIFLTSTVLHATERYEFYNGIREMGMGGASVGVVNDETALILNPAGLGKIRSSIITIVDPEIGIGANSESMLKDTSTPTSTSYKTNFFALQDLVDGVEGPTKTNQHFHANMQVFPSLVIPNFGFGLLGSYVFDTDTYNAGNSIDVHYKNDYGFVVGYNFRLLDGRIKIGFNGKFVNRVELNKTFLATDTGLQWQNQVSEGGGIGSDVGIILTAPWATLPSLSAVVHDVGNTRYDLTNGAVYKTGTHPNEVKQTIDAAFSIFPIHSNRVRSTITLEMSDVTNQQEPNSTDAFRRYHVGVELNISDMFFIRGGMNQRYYTAGLEFSTERFQFQLASYGEEIGTDTTPKEDRRYVIKTAIRF